MKHGTYTLQATNNEGKNFNLTVPAFELPDVLDDFAYQLMSKNSKPSSLTHSLSMRRKTEGLNFSIPELDPVVRSLIELLSQSKKDYKNHDDFAIQFMQDRLKFDIKEKYPYYQTVLDIFNANIMLDYIYTSKSGLQSYYPDGQCKTKIHVEKNRKAFLESSTLGLGVFDYTRYINLFDIYKMGRDEIGFYDDYCQYSTPAGNMNIPKLLSKLLYEDGKVVIPTFADLNQDDFVRAFGLPIHFIRLARGPVAVELSETRAFTRGLLSFMDIMRSARYTWTKHSMACPYPDEFCLSDKYHGMMNVINRATINSLYNSIDNLTCIKHGKKTLLKHRVRNFIYRYFYLCDNCLSAADITGFVYPSFVGWYEKNNPKFSFDSDFRAVKNWVTAVSLELLTNDFIQPSRIRLCQIYYNSTIEMPTALPTLRPSAPPFDDATAPPVVKKNKKKKKKRKHGKKHPLQ